MNLFTGFRVVETVADNPVYCSILAAKLRNTLTLPSPNRIFASIWLALHDKKVQYRSLSWQSEATSDLKGLLKSQNEEDVVLFFSTVHTHAA